jgi:hypothetical protein
MKRKVRGRMNEEIMEIPELEEEIVEEFRKLKYDPNAKSSYEWMSGGLIWKDEFTSELIAGLSKQTHPIINYLLRYLWAYRSSLVVGKERLEFRKIWQTVYSQVPFWPGFTPERLDSSLAKKLFEGRKQMEQELDSLTCTEDSD